MRVRNTHGALCDGIEAGAEGEVDDKNPGVQVHLRAGLLVEIAPPAPPPPVEAAVEGDAANAGEGESTGENTSETPGGTRRARRTG